MQEQYKVEILPIAWEDLKSVEDYYLLRFGVESAMKVTDQILNSNSSTSVIKELLVTPYKRGIINLSISSLFKERK